MEETHKHVRENAKGAMHRQKKYYDQKLSWQVFSQAIKYLFSGPLHKHASLVVNPGLTFGKKTNT
jgi:hypothetical protein